MPDSGLMRAAIFGASGGIGAALASALRAGCGLERLYACSRRTAAAEDERVVPLAFDLTDAASIVAAEQRMAAEGPLDLVIVATGALVLSGGIGPEKALRQIDPAAMAEPFRINTIGPALIARQLLPSLRRDARAVFAVLGARVGSIGDNRLGGWHSYRASKAALNMLVRNFAIDIARSHPRAVVAAIHPGTMTTGLSAPFRPDDAPGVFTPAESAAHVLAVLARLGPDDSGGQFAWDGSRIPD